MSGVSGLRSDASTRRRTPTRPNAVFATGHRSGTGGLRAALARHPDLAWVTAEDFEHVDGDARSFPLNTFDAGFTTDPEAADAFEAIARRHAGRAAHAAHAAHPQVIAWQPEHFIELPHVLWQTVRHLSDARVLFCLRDPVAATHHRFRVQPDHMPERFDDAITQCVERMEHQSRFEFRGRWTSFHADPDPLALLLQGGVYEPAVSRCLRLLRPDQVRVVVWERLLANPDDELAELHRFLGLAPAPPDAAAAAVLIDDDGDADAAMTTETRQRLEQFFARFNEALARRLGWSASPWP